MAKTCGFRLLLMRRKWDNSHTKEFFGHTDWEISLTNYKISHTNFTISLTNYKISQTNFPFGVTKNSWDAEAALIRSGE